MILYWVHIRDYCILIKYYPVFLWFLRRDVGRFFARLITVAYRTQYCIFLKNSWFTIFCASFSVLIQWKLGLFSRDSISFRSSYVLEVKKVRKIHKKTSVSDCFLKKIAGLRRFPLNFAKFLRTTFFTEHLRAIASVVLFIVLLIPLPLTQSIFPRAAFMQEKTELLFQNISNCLFNEK